MSVQDDESDAAVAERDAPRTALAQAEDDRTDACLARWEEEQDNQRLRTAHKSAVARGVRLCEQCASLAAQVAGVDDATRRLDAVLKFCDRAEKRAARWENPLPVPEWVTAVRALATGTDGAGTEVRSLADAATATAVLPALDAAEGREES
ncbi:hypothetical protein AB0P17_29490 [Streptomyces sp. NPDC088124]|uniref:hypothetical protein n=1 Tax=Streptomyces sp. NPDC088124 TaxID=3154654 RepID=UPI00344087C7